MHDVYRAKFAQPSGKLDFVKKQRTINFNYIFRGLINLEELRYFCNSRSTEAILLTLLSLNSFTLVRWRE